MITLIRILIILSGLTVWLLLYLDVRFAYTHTKGFRRGVIQLSLVFGASAIFVTQVRLMDRFVPIDAQGDRFFIFVLIECGGALILMFATAFYERTKGRRGNSHIEE